MSVGSTLENGRRMARMSLEDVSAYTRLRPTVLAAIEADDFAVCGGYTYARGHVRTYALAVGLDPDMVVAEFDAERNAAAPQVDSMRKDFEPGRRSIDDAPRAPNWSGVARIALAVLVVLVVIGLFLRSRGN